MRTGNKWKWKRDVLVFRHRTYFRGFLSPFCRIIAFYPSSCRRRSAVIPHPLCAYVNIHRHKTVKLLKSFKIIIVAPTCFVLHKPSSGSSQLVLRQSYNVDIGYIYRYLKLSVLWLHVLFSPVMRVDRALCRVELQTPYI